MPSVVKALSQNIKTVSSQIYNPSESLTAVISGYYVSQRCTEPKLLCREIINKLWKLYRSILSKCMYTSLELPVHLPVVSNMLSHWGVAPRPHKRSPSLVLMDCLLVDFHTYNLVKVGSSDNNKKQWQNF